MLRHFSKTLAKSDVWLVRSTVPYLALRWILQSGTETTVIGRPRTLLSDNR